jgi:hypothetical protein
LFLGIATSGSGTNGYDPWVDLNDDGNIDYNDLYTFARAYGSSGTPINKTALLLELLSRIDSLNASLIALESRVEALETALAKIREPDYDSGWVTVKAGERLDLTHNLNTTEVFVYVVGRYGPPDNTTIHQIYYGGYCYYLYDGTGHVYASVDQGLEWIGLTNTTIALYRHSDDFYWQQVRVMIWKIKEP